MAILNGKKTIIIGDRDGIPGPAIESVSRQPALRLFIPLRSASSERPQVPWIWRTRRE